MPSKFLPEISKSKFDEVLNTNDDSAFFEMLVQPLHEELYKRNDFAFMNELSEMQQLFLSYDYLRAQVGQGGFIQFLANGYAPLLMNMPEWLKKAKADDMAQLIDDVLKVFVLNNEFFKKEMSVDEFGKLYEELKEFEELDKRYEQLNAETLTKLVNFAKENVQDFATLT